MEHSTISTMLQEYNRLVAKVMVINPSLGYRERKSFKDRNDALKSLERIKSTMRAINPEPQQKKEVKSMSVHQSTSEVSKTSAKVEENETKRRGRKPIIGDEMLITILAKENPKREGTKGFKYWLMYEEGMTVGEYRDLLGKDFGNWFNWDLKHHLIAVKKP